MMPTMFSTAKHEILRIYRERAGARYGLEEISQLEHALQTASLAEKQGESPAFIVAALLHDVGHMLDGLAENPAADGIDGLHERLGADWLAARLPAAVSEPVRLHVQAKRYLCAVDPGYARQLAPDSVRSLALQGGPMTVDESARFVQQPFAADALRLRRLDDTAKLAECSTPALDHFLDYFGALELDPLSAEQRGAFGRDGFVVLRGFFSASEQRELQGWSARFGAKARQILRSAAQQSMSLATHAQRFPHELIVVAEAADPAQVCRFEYLLGNADRFADFIRARVTPVVSFIGGEPFLPFKDKENEKHPGGGAFGPHQDFAAYQAFGPRYNLTAMLSIDPQTPANGCLAFATNLAEAAREPDRVVQWVGGRPLLRYRTGGPTNGDVHEDVVAALAWKRVETTAADLVVFDSFVPHRSESNRTLESRRAMFLTYAPARDGDWYERYYADKRKNYDDPKFHVSTPTARSGHDAS